MTIIEGVIIFILWWSTGVLFLTKDWLGTYGEVTVGEFIRFTFFAVVLGGPIAFIIYVLSDGEYKSFNKRILFSIKSNPSPPAQ